MSNAEYLKSKGWKLIKTMKTKKGFDCFIWEDPISGYEFTQSKCVEWQRKRDAEPELSM